VGRLIETLKSSGKYDNTLIVYITDNGAPFPGSKTTLYEPGIRLPCIVKVPKPGKTNFIQDALISWLDITPTLLDFARALPRNAQFQGRSFKEIIEQEKVVGWDEVYGSHNLHEIMMYYPMRMIRERRFKLIYNIAYELKFPQALDLYQSYTWQSAIKTNIKLVGTRFLRINQHHPKFELYDLQNDPDEVFNLAADPKYSNELRRLQEKLKTWQKDTKDIWISKWEFE
jgi:N-sulfoglucosamine sulfohydrolase